MTHLFIDVETLPGQTEAAREQARADTKPPGTLKKPESIAAWWEAEGEAAIEATWRKQALDPAAGELCSVSFATSDTAAVSIVRARVEPEAAFLRRAISVIDKALADAAPALQADGTPWPFAEDAYCVAHNAEFDLGFLRARCWANRVRVPRWLPKPGSRAPRDFGCTMTLFSGHGGKIGLDKLCRALGVPSPKADGTTGADVLDLWLAGEHDKLARYNAADVTACAACWWIMAGLEAAA